MPSSTFSSDFPLERSPASSGTAFVSSLVLAVVLLAGIEGVLRVAGHQPSVIDTPDLWALHRAKVPSGIQNHVVVLGFSRIQLGFSPAEFREERPNFGVTQLAINGRHPIAALRDLADQSEFSGVVICDITPAGFSREHWDSQAEYVSHYQNRYRPWHAVGTEGSLFFQKNLVLVNPQVSLVNNIRKLIGTGTLPQPRYLTILSDRSVLADYTQTDRDEKNQQLPCGGWYRGVRLDAEAWLRDVQAVDSYVKTITKRGGRVVFLRMPIHRDLWLAENERNPRKLFWDKMAESTNAATVHFKDHPSLDKFSLPDCSHLDQRDTPEFTRCLVNILSEQKVL